MKIEKINDKQIRCTLTKEDLANREIKLSELAYGSEKTRALFQDMMRVAAQDFGFEADNMPLVIEAIPVSMDSIILIITKVEDPEELDTRFARFSPEEQDGDSGYSFSDLMDRIEGADDILGLIKKISEAKKRAASKNTEQESPAEEPSAVSVEEDEEVINLTRFYLFRSLDDVIRASRILGPVFSGPNTLYKNPESGEFYLILKKASSTAEQFNKVCNVLSEYALPCKFSAGMDAHFTEHMEVTIPENALQNLSLLG
ncbi:MAG TPA: adaptor protein MecA [Candidatus Choladousia intestinigallinarum]|nr:adaptor protein MecA [Candidatus Choladousia intestinigallinarum]